MADGIRIVHEGGPLKGERIFGADDKEISFGWAGAIPIVGDWNGDGPTKIGVVNQGFWFLDYDGNYVWDGGTTDKIAGWGPDWTPVPGKW